MERKRKKGNIAGQWFGLWRESVKRDRIEGGSGGMEMDKRGEGGDQAGWWWRRKGGSNYVYMGKLLAEAWERRVGGDMRKG